MLKESILTYVNQFKYTALATSSLEHKPEAAIVGFVFTWDFEIVFDTATDSRKHANLQLNPDVAFVFGGEESEITVQYEGTAQELKGPELVYYKQLYFDKFPDGREREKQWNIAYYLVRPTRIRYSNFGISPANIEEIHF